MNIMRLRITRQHIYFYDVTATDNRSLLKEIGLPDARHKYMLLRMNAQQLISDLRAIGLSQHEIAAGIGATQSTVSRIAAGKLQRFRYDIGEHLVAMHKRHFSRRRK